jgi:hypothetical protein
VIDVNKNVDRRRGLLCLFHVSTPFCDPFDLDVGLKSSESNR